MVSYRAWSCPETNAASSSSTSSDSSDRSKSTAPTIYSDRPMPKRPREEMDLNDDEGPDPGDSASTFDSSTSADEIDEPPLFEVPDRRRAIFRPDVIPSTSSSFAKLFPSRRRLLIRHDDQTDDGNMQLRVDTRVPHRGGYQQDVVLFHLRMYDLFTRKFSFRRYCRDSGREVCHSERRAVSSTFVKAPMLQRSWTSVLASLRPGSSGYGHHKRRGSEQSRFSEDVVSGIDRPAALADSIMLEFSNYAHVELKRRGAGRTKRYEYEYWATKYQWRRKSRREGDLREVSYHLVDMRTAKKVAHIVPEILSPQEAIEEEDKGGWIPPSSMWISDVSAYKMHDVADVIVATGLIVLVDDCIRNRWPHGTSMPRRRISAVTRHRQSDV
ncbi:hypothetical protein BDV10DRAFT_94945 [Aspergillus recurvatus]